jgi:hypothetical protein
MLESELKTRILANEFIMKVRYFQLDHESFKVLCKRLFQKPVFKPPAAWCGGSRIRVGLCWVKGA